MYHGHAAYQTPYIFGHEPSGYIIRKGKNVDGFGVGDRVTWWFSTGAFAQYCVVTPKKVCMTKLPEQISRECAPIFELVFASCRAVRNCHINIEYGFDTPEKISELRFVFDSDLNRLTVAEDSPFRQFSMSCNIRLADKPLKVPVTLIKAFRIETLKQDGSFDTICEINNNHQRLVRVSLQIQTKAIRFIPIETWGSEQAVVFAWDIR